MKVAQTELSETEYNLILDYAKKRGLSLKQALREGVIRLVLDDEVVRDDPIFSERPVAKATGKRERTSAEHDKLLYGLQQ